MNNLPPSGTKDYSGDEISIKEFVLQEASKIAILRGFARIETPAFENTAILMKKYGEEGEGLTFQVLNQKEKESSLTLRYDLTIPAMRFYAKNKEDLPSVFKKFQYGSVWRADRPGKDRYREFCQFDFDIYGSSSILADCECLQSIINVLDNLGIKGYTVNVNSRKIITLMTQWYGLDKENANLFIREIDKIDKTGISTFLCNIKNFVTEDNYNSIKNDFNGSLDSILQQKILETEDGKNIWNELSIILGLVSKNGKICFNPLMVRGLDYYTGIIYEITAPECKGSIAGGGRYDNLSNLFMTRQSPACGASLGIDRILSLIQSKPQKIVTKVYVGIWSQADIQLAYNLNENLINSGINSSINLYSFKIRE